MNILITGGSGFLGRHLVKYYLDKGDNVTSLARNEYLQWCLKQRCPDVGIILDDVRDFKTDKKYDSIIHCAAMKHVGLCEENREKAHDINVYGTQNMLYFAKNTGIENFILIIRLAISVLSQMIMLLYIIIMDIFI